MIILLTIVLALGITKLYLTYYRLEDKFDSYISWIGFLTSLAVYYLLSVVMPKVHKQKD